MSLGIISKPIVPTWCMLTVTACDSLHLQTTVIDFLGFILCYNVQVILKAWSDTTYTLVAQL